MEPIRPILDPRAGDLEDDASSTKRRSMLSLAGSLLAEISPLKLLAAWLLLIGLPGLLLGAAPLIVTLWLAMVSRHAASLLDGVGPALVMVPLAALAWFGWRPLLLLAENSFWSLNALAVQPFYIVSREGLRHLTEGLLMGRLDETRRAGLRAGTAAAAGLGIAAAGSFVLALTWPATRWIGTLDALAAPRLLVMVLLANGLAIIVGYFAVAGLIWGIADATMPQPRDVTAFAPAPAGAQHWRIAHLSDLHTVGERYGFRVESGRSGPRGNDRLRATLARLDAIHAAEPLDMVLITGDLTDAGRSAEWAEFFAILADHPALAAIVVALPGNHDVNVVDRASPARMDLPLSPMPLLRQMRTLSALAVLQGTRLRLVDGTTGAPGPTLAETLAPQAAAMVAFADRRPAGSSRALAALWQAAFPMVLPPETEDGLGILVLNSNAQTHFSFTNALGLVTAAQSRAVRSVIGRYPRACWIVALHHHVIEYPQRAKALSERIGTALINGSWFIRQLRPLDGRAVLMHGHRHIDWIGSCGGLLVISAPSPVMEAGDDAETGFYLHTLAIGTTGELLLLQPERVVVPGAAGDGGVAR